MRRPITIRAMPSNGFNRCSSAWYSGLRERLFIASRCDVPTGEAALSVALVLDGICGSYLHLPYYIGRAETALAELLIR
jgi:hypothetical protein